MIVLDASAAVEFLLGTAVGQRIGDRLTEDAPQAPHVVDAEVTQVLHRFVRTESITAERGRQALGDFVDLRLSRYPHVPLLGRAWELRDNATAYGALYLVLAEALDVPLLTTDARLSSIAGCEAAVEVVD